MNTNFATPSLPARSRVKHFAKMVLGKLPWFKEEVSIPKVTYGTDYGGWTITPSLVNADSIVYSFGIGHDASWDIGMIEQHGCKVYAFDPTPDLDQWIAAQGYDPRFIFDLRGLAGFDGQVEIRSQSTDEQTSGTILGSADLGVDTKGTSIEVRKIKTLADELGHSHIDVLKMDIEGAEFDAIPDILASGITVDQILIEFHPYFTNGVSRWKTNLEQLNKAGYRLFDVSRRALELGFIHESALKRLGK